MNIYIKAVSLILGAIGIKMITFGIIILVDMIKRGKKIGENNSQKLDY